MTLIHELYTALLAGLMKTLGALISLLLWLVLIYGPRRVVPHSIVLILPRATPKLNRWRRSSSTAQQSTSYLMGCHRLS